MNPFEYREQLIGIYWVQYAKLQLLSTTHIIDHMLTCQKYASESLQRQPYRDEKPDDHTAMWAAYGNQVMWCLQILVERDIYEAEPYRDDRGQEFFMALEAVGREESE